MGAQWVVHLTTRTGLDGGLAATCGGELARRMSGDEVALLVPTQQAAETARRLVLQARPHGEGLLDARIMTFPRLAEAVLVANHHGARQLTPIQRELLVGAVLEELAAEGQLGYLERTHTRPGAVNAVCALLDEIKRGGVSSEDFPRLAAKRAGDHPATAVIARIFSRYQDRLKSLDLYDEPGLFWHALEVLQSGQRRPLEDLKVLLLDGFQEFTTTQWQMLQTLAETVERVELRLWLDDARRPDMTPRSRATLDMLMQSVRPEVLRETAEEASGETNLERLQSTVFGRDDAGIPRADGSVQVIEVAGGMVGECREVARRIKALLKDRPDLEPNRVAVFLRSWDGGYDAALRQALDWYGVPVDLATGPALASVPAVQAALDALDVVVGGWRREDVIKLLNSNYVLPLLSREDGLSARRLERIALEAGIMGGLFDAGGRAAWARGLEQLAKRVRQERMERQELEQSLKLTPDSEDTRRTLQDEDGNRFRTLRSLDGTLSDLERAGRLVGKLAALLGPVQRAEALAAAALGFAGLVEQLGIPRAAGRGEPARVAVDLAGLAAFADLLRAIAETPDVLGIDAGGDAAQFTSLLRQACNTTRLGGTRRRHSGVQVLDIGAAGLEPFAVVVVCGLRDGLFPARGRQDVFYSDAERVALHETVPGLGPRLGDQHDDEHLLWAALAAAQEQAWLSYPLADAGGAPVLRSQYVDEALRHWEAGDDGRPPAGLLHTRRQSEVITPLDRAGQYLEALEAAMDHRRPASVNAQAVAALEPPAGLPSLASVRALAEVEAQRSSADAHGIYSGVLPPGSAAAEAIAANYGPDHVYSVSQLNTYIGCPMRFFLGRVLGLEELAAPTEGLDRRDLGSLAHRVLAEFFRGRTVGTDNAEPITPQNLLRAQEDLAACIDAVCDSWPQTVFGDEKVWARAIDRVRADLGALLEHEAERNTEGKGRKRAWCPPRQVYTVEAYFGPGGQFSVQTRLDDPVRISGRIDRVDITWYEGRRYWVIWDYKTGGGVSASAVEAGLDLQLPIYAMAVQRLYGNQPEGAPAFHLWGYYRVSRPVHWPSVVAGPAGEETAELLNGIMETARECIADVVEAIRRGEFPLEPEEAVAPCRYCDFRRACRRGIVSNQ